MKQPSTLFQNSKHPNAPTTTDNNEHMHNKKLRIAFQEQNKQRKKNMKKMAQKTE